MTTSTPLAGLAARLAETACVSAPFHLADGTRLDAYFDEYRLAADPALLRDTAAAMASLIPDNAQLLAGIELGGVPLVVALSAATGLPAVFLRRRPKSYGSRRQVEGAALDGRRAVLVDDVVRSGGQLLTTARTLRVAGAPVTDALCVLERSLGGRMLLAEHRVTLHSSHPRRSLHPHRPAFSTAPKDAPPSCRSPRRLADPVPCQIYPQSRADCSTATAGSPTGSQ